MKIIHVEQGKYHVDMLLENEGGRAHIRMEYVRTAPFEVDEWTITIFLKPFGEYNKALDVQQGIKNRDSLSWIATRWACMFLGIKVR